MSRRHASRRIDRRASTRRLLRAEPLETRRLMAYDIDFDDGAIRVEGGANDDNIVIYAAGDELVVEIRDRATGEVIEDYDRDIEDVLAVEVFGFDGADTIFNSTAVRMEAFGGLHDDILIGGSGADWLDGDDGIDWLYGGANDDVLQGGEGNDTLYGQGDDDSLWGEGGNDILKGGVGNDYLSGGFDNDTYEFEGSGLGTDYIHEPGYGIDTLDFSQFLTGVTVNLGQQQLVQSAQLNLSMDGGTLENVIGTAYNDTLTGNAASNTLRGCGGNDTLTGGGGLDYLYGDAGNDTLHGDAVDQLFGGRGIDWFDGWFENPWFPNPRPGFIRDWGRF
jgi:Ca2+-binding RTX toxin-like protein